jgi:hypothetical protein
MNEAYNVVVLEIRNTRLDRLTRSTADPRSNYPSVII